MERGLLQVHLFFLSLESFVAELFKVLSCFKEINLEKAKDRNIYQKICWFCDEIDYEKIFFMMSDVYKKLEEFHYFRNALFHANSINKKISIQKTIFSPFPVLANIADAIQALDIYIAIITIFRRIFNGVDLMPQIFMKDYKTEVVVFIPVDQIYEKIILKSYYEILSKHNLTTQFKKTDWHFSYLPLEYVYVDPLIKLEQDKLFEYDFNSEETKIFMKNYQNFLAIKTEGLEANTLRLPDLIPRKVVL